MDSGIFFGSFFLSSFEFFVAISPVNRFFEILGRIPLKVFSATISCEVDEMTMRVWTRTFFLEVFSCDGCIFSDDGASLTLAKHSPCKAIANHNEWI